MHLRTTLAACSLALLMLSACATGAHRLDAARIAVVGPLAQSEESHAFGAAAYTERPEDLAAQGYLEEEFIISGAANVYEWDQLGPVAVRAPNAPYATRVLVRRPAAAEDFSGRVIVEMLNPSNLIDLNIGWAIHHDEIVRSGDAWVGITAKPVAVISLKTFDLDRYAALSWPNPLPLDDPRNCEVQGSNYRRSENGLVWDINTQVAEWARSWDASNPFLYGSRSRFAHPVEQLYGWGYSQTGGFLATYIQAIHPRVKAETGADPFDGYIVAVASGLTPINQCAERVGPDDPRRVFRDVGVPVMHVMTQSDYRGYGPTRREDGDDPADGFRYYELAGAGHATPDELWYGPRFADIEQAGRTPPTFGCNEGPRSRFPSAVGFNAIYRNLKSWVEDGVPPPPSQRINVSADEPVLDEHGNVTGGVRSPLLDVPTSTWAGNSTGESFCRIAGHEVPFSAATLADLYESQEAYETAFEARLNELITARFITPEDGEMLMDMARETEIR
ncbi:MAG: alpha/beta hydrolase domain-containing protein [Maricaulaceae bacterium]|jgi:hypothetical protein